MTEFQAAVAQALAKKVGLSVDQLRALLTESAENANAKAVAAHTTKSDYQTDNKARFAALVGNTFRKLGFKDCVPNEDIRTYGRWEEAGYRLKANEHGYKFGRQGRGFKYMGKNEPGKRIPGKGVTLFHKSQVEAVANVVPLKP